MAASKKFTKLRRFNVATHRDVGYFFSTLIIIYCLSGLALNHVNEWNPDFIITKKTIKLDPGYQPTAMNNKMIDSLGLMVGETKYKVYDVPTRGQVKIYYEDASFHVNFKEHTGLYEKVSRRPVFYQSNILHRNSLKGWKWIADIFAVMLIVISVSGLFVLKGKYGITGRGKWLIGAGFLVPVIAIVINALT